MEDKKKTVSPILQFRASQELKDDFERIAYEMGYIKPSGGANSSELLRHISIAFVNNYKKNNGISNEFTIEQTINGINTRR